MAWSRRFDTPIRAGRRNLTTLRDAARYILWLPKAKRVQPHWQLAAQLLLSAAEQGGILMMAEIAVRQALAHGRNDKKPLPPGKGKQGLKRDR